MSDLDKFVMDAGIVADCGDLSDPAKNALYEYALSFLKCGGVLSYQDFYLMTPKTKEAFALAKTTLEAEKITVLATILGAKMPKARKNPSAPENREAWASRDDQAAVSATMGKYMGEVTK